LGLRPLLSSSPRSAPRDSLRSPGSAPSCTVIRSYADAQRGAGRLCRAQHRWPAL
jgi:hypothetical protein